MQLSVVICVKNEVNRINDCLDSVMTNDPKEIILVDGGSTDGTVEIVKKYENVKIIISKNSNLTRDRQLGIDSSSSEFVALIDADHRLRPNDLDSLLNDLKKNKFDIVQSGLRSYTNSGFWVSAEDQSWQLIQNVPGPRNMIGTAPAIYNKRVFNFAKFDDKITKTIDDTDFSYRLSQHKGIKMGVGNTVIAQHHFSSFSDYVKKFLWYGKGDGEFCIKNPERTLSMLYHLGIRYPLLYSIKALFKGKIKVIPFFIFQGLLRLVGLILLVLKSKIKVLS